MRRSVKLALAPLFLSLLLVGTHTAAADTTSEQPDPIRDTQNIIDAYGRIIGPGGQLRNPRYLPALIRETSLVTAAQLLTQAANPTRLAITAGQVVPGWNVGNPLRAGWEGSRGRSADIAFTNRYGALLRGKVWAPLDDATDPYTGEALQAPYPGVVITTGSIQGSQGMYEWLAQDLAERGYVVLTYDVQGQGESETLPHETDSALPFCNPFAPPKDGEMFGCPGVPFQQLSNFVVGTEDALDFFTATPESPYPNTGAAGADVTPYNPFHELFDTSPDPTPNAPGRTTRIAIVGHSLGAAAVSKVQGTDERVSTVIALDKLAGPDADGALDGEGNVPTVPALAVQSEYGFTVSPWWLSGDSLIPAPSPGGPDPQREKATGYDAWRAADVDSMLIVPRASTHLDYTDIPLVLPASRHGQALTSVYVQAWLDRYLRDAPRPDALLAGSFDYLEPVGNGAWSPIELQRDDLLSFYYCSAHSLSQGGQTHVDPDIADVGC